MNEKKFFEKLFFENGESQTTSQGKDIHNIVLLEKKPSKIHGFGIFTKHTIPEDTAFHQVSMDLIHTEPTPNCARIASRMFVDDAKILNWVNHSCVPNAKIELQNQGLYLVSTRKILAGEEITVDYLLNEERNNLHQCNCKSPKCRNYFATT